MENMQKQKQDKTIFEQSAGESTGFTEKYTSDLIKKILQKKLAYNHKCLNHNMPMLTPKQYLFIFFAETFTMKNLISENINLLMLALDKFKKNNSIIKLGYCVLANLCDENFFLVYEGLRTTMKEFFKGYIQELFASESQDLQNKVFKKKITNISKLTKKEVKFLVSEMVSNDREAVMVLAENVEFYSDLKQILLSHFVGNIHNNSNF